MPAVMLRAAACTHPGRVRLNNEDVALVDAARGVFGVIDGIGGHAGGEVAAGVAKDVVMQRLSRPVGSAVERVREAIAIANNEIFRRAAGFPELAGMACVITLAVVADGRLTIGHVGDTRLYKLRPGGMHKLTRDHSPIGEREDSGEMSEAAAMRHPHRNEVFRDVGTVFRDKDEQEFVDVTEEPLESDAAILICSDGLSDMVPAATIAHVVRQHAGHPQSVVEALVVAANDAGGRDNVTVVYAEMPLFADGIRGRDQRLAPTERFGHDRAAAASSADRSGSPAREGWMRRTARAFVASRTTWFTIGVLLGVIGALALTAYVATTQARGPRTLIVAPDGTSPFRTITAALAEARPGDVVRVDPGVYREQVGVRDGIDLVARLPGTVTVARPANSEAPGMAITGTMNVRVAGIKIAPDGATDVGVRILAPAVTLELVEIAGDIQRALAVAPASSVTVRGSRIAVPGTLLAVPDDGHATFVDSVLTRTATSAAPALTVTPSGRLVLQDNVFAGFPAGIVEGVSRERLADLLAGNIVVADRNGSDAAPAQPRGHDGPGTASGRGRGSASHRPRAAGGGR